MITFGKRSYSTWPSVSEGIGELIHLFGEMDLPINATIEQAWEYANDVAEAVGYLASRVGENQLRVAGESYWFLVTYENGKLVDVQDIRLEYLIKDREGWNEIWRNRIESENLQEEKLDGYLEAIERNNRMIEEYRAQIALRDAE